MAVRIGQTVLLAGICMTPVAHSADGPKQPASAAPEVVSRFARDANWSLRMPEDDKVAFTGAVNLDQAGSGMRPIVYPVPGVIGLVAAMAAHGAVVGSLKNQQKNQLQQDANLVLKPFEATLGQFRYSELVRRALTTFELGGNGAMIAHADKRGALPLIEAQPSFMMTQDRQTVILDNVIVIYPQGSTSQPYLNTVRIVSTASNGANPVETWGANDGAHLKQVSAMLFAQSLALAFDDALASASSDANANAFKTIRYLEGGNERVERAQLLKRECGRVVIRNLRGWLMSVPIRDGGGQQDAQCTSVPASATGAAAPVAAVEPGTANFALEHDPGRVASPN